MKAQVVQARVDDARREEYLDAWAEWSGTLLPMGIRTELLESQDDRGAFVELTWFEEGQESAMADDRLVKIESQLSAAASERSGARELYRSASPG